RRHGRDVRERPRPGEPADRARPESVGPGPRAGDPRPAADRVRADRPAGHRPDPDRARPRRAAAGARRQAALLPGLERLRSLSPAAWATKVVNHVGDATFSIHPLPGEAVDCGISSQPGPWDGCARLPTYIQTQGAAWTKLGEITFTSSDLLAGGSVAGGAAVLLNLKSYALRFSTIVEGLR